LLFFCVKIRKEDRLIVFEYKIKIIIYKKGGNVLENF